MAVGAHINPTNGLVKGSDGTVTVNFSDGSMTFPSVEEFISIIKSFDDKTTADGQLNARIILLATCLRRDPTITNSASWNNRNVVIDMSQPQRVVGQGTGVPTVP